MNALWISIYLASGIGLLYYGGDKLILGATSLAIRKGLSRMTVGLTVVALGTSAPEFFVSLLAVARGSTQISIGNIIGSNIANIALILGISALLAPLASRSRTLRFEMPLVLFASLLAYLLALWSRNLGRIDGLLLFSLFALFLYYCSRNRYEAELMARGTGLTSCLRTDILLILSGLVGLGLGSELFVRGAVQLARQVGVSELVIGLTVVAVGTSLPELAASIIALVRKEMDISVGNILGSNLFNLLFVLGSVATIHPLPCEPQALWVDFPVMIAFTILAFIFLLSRKTLARWEGGTLLFFYVLYLTGMAFRI